MTSSNEKSKKGRETKVDLKIVREIIGKINIDEKQCSLKKLNFVYFTEELLFDAMPKDFIIEALKNPSVPTQTKFELTELLGMFNEVTSSLNNEVKDLKRFKIEPRGLHVVTDKALQDRLIESVVNVEADSLRKLNKDIYDQIVLTALREDDYIKPQEGNKLHWLSFMIPDGKVFPYTILRENVFSKYGFPIGLYTKEGEDINPASVKYLFYEDPLTKKVMKGIYFEVYEGPGQFGSGGINGIIAPGDKPLVIINHKRREAYFVNFKDNKKLPSLDELISEKISIVG